MSGCSHGTLGLQVGIEYLRSCQVNNLDKAIATGQVKGPIGRSLMVVKEPLDMRARPGLARQKARIRSPPATLGAVFIGIVKEKKMQQAMQMFTLCRSIFCASELTMVTPKPDAIVVDALCMGFDL